jgi:hypothetical protein
MGPSAILDDLKKRKISGACLTEMERFQTAAFANEICFSVF